MPSGSAAVLLRETPQQKRRDGRKGAYRRIGGNASVNGWEGAAARIQWPVHDYTAGRGSE